MEALRAFLTEAEQNVSWDVILIQEIAWPRSGWLASGFTAVMGHRVFTNMASIDDTAVVVHRRQEGETGRLHGDDAQHGSPVADWGQVLETRFGTFTVTEIAYGKHASGGGQKNTRPL